MSGILVTGGGGQVATALAALGGLLGLPIRHVGRPAFDFDQPDSIDATFARFTPGLVLNAAAYTAVDKAESDQDAAWRGNHAGPARLATLCAAAGARLVHISTDYVFDGGKSEAYVETDATAPTGVYGASKLAGERAVRDALPDALILRTAWVYAATGKNFLLTMVNAARKTAQLKVVADQVGCPTLASDLAEAILQIVTRPGWTGGTFHAAGSGETSWHGFATAILDRAAEHGLARPQVTPIATADWPTPAHRPANSRLDCGKLRGAFGIALPAWQDSMCRTVDAVLTRDPAASHA
jgi:dTDP-4-dehydrorhamnose reductase